MLSLIYNFIGLVAIIGSHGDPGKVALKRANLHEFEVMSVFPGTVDQFLKNKYECKAVIVDSTKVTPKAIAYLKNVYAGSTALISIVSDREQAVEAVDRVFGQYI